MSDYFEVAAQRPFPIGRGPLACVARDQIRDRRPVGGSLAFRVVSNECANSSRSDYYLHGE